MDKLKHIIEENLNLSELESEDSGAFKYFIVSNDFDSEEIHVKICSWDESKEHLEFNKFINRRVRITIETID